jgi:large subunit ribosomal protein L24
MREMGRETMTAKIRLKKNDVVKVISGREKGKTGRILSIDGDSLRAMVEGLNMVKKAVKKKKQNQKGGITTVEAPMALGKLMIICKKCGATRITFKIDGEKKSRVCRKCGGAL